ncbi:hypothetical protein T01_8083 [Trichinella spiralis]|uniref:Uncharacterized protein n=1 Tax=Trichinella spiralis TaxID=6334 RepID=A0A0V0Z5P4_TRISP|nr:hypothetical protein T01_8083 [Trichinella spiralis]
MELYSLLLRSQVSFPFLLFPLKLQHYATFLTISRQIRIYKTCDQQGYSLCCFCNFRK